MANKRWDEAQELFDRGLHLSAAARSAILATTDAELAAMVLRLWENNAAVGAFLQSRQDQNNERTGETTGFGFAGEAHRFEAGTVLGGRYRILDMVGRGGMGEVYKAFDLVLNQHIALKFLPPEASGNKAALARLRNEVRIARQVSHPNVCRVYDIGIIEGLHAICMEYVDGENLSSLLHRIGHLPQDKAVEIARRLCAGLAAAHDRGVLHRDLKPANIMIDGQGRARIMDFGISVLSHELRDGELSIGTPTYMAPEHLAGKEFTVRSDIYALGLVLSEVFTGEQHPGKFKTGLDPMIVRLIERCTDPNPSRRPTSAMAVMFELPGGDPISAALAAGETPSPEMVAASGVREGFKTTTAVILFALVAAAIIGNVMLGKKAYVMGRAPVEFSTEVLVFKAREMLRQFGYESLPYNDWASGFVYSNRGYPHYVKRTEALNYLARLASQQPPVVSFFYRQSPNSLVSTLLLAPGVVPGGLVTDTFPANTDPGSVVMKLDGKGRLVYLEIRSTDIAPEAAAPRDFDWTALLSAGGLSAQLLRQAPQTRTPSVAYDSRLAWDGKYAADRPDTIHVEAAAFRGRPVHFEIFGPWPDTSSRDFPVPESENENPGERSRFLWAVFGSWGLLICAAVLATRNLSLSRGDRRGATRLGILMFSLTLTSALLIGHHVANYNELMNLLLALSWASFIATLTTLLYLAAEPYVRRNWPDSLVSWSRLLCGQIREPLVASHILAGIAAGAALQMVRMVIVSFGYGDFIYPLLQSLEGTPHMVGGMIAGALTSTFFVIVALLVLVLIRVAARHNWLGNILWLLLLAVSADNASTAGEIRRVVLGLFLLWLLHRYGMLVIVTMTAVLRMMSEAPVLVAAPNAGPAFTVSVFILIIAAVALYVITSRPPARDATAR
ncbi:MAG: serine/threonine-protein kinase [Bryobacteraceae bacterium]